MMNLMGLIWYCIKLFPIIFVKIYKFGFPTKLLYEVNINEGITSSEEMTRPPPSYNIRCSRQCVFKTINSAQKLAKKNQRWTRHAHAPL